MSHKVTKANFDRLLGILVLLKEKTKIRKSQYNFFGKSIYGSNYFHK